MRSGSPIQFDLALYDAAGAGLTYADAAAFATAGWALDFIDMATGVAVSPALSYTMAPVTGVPGRHTVALTLTTAAWFVRVTPPTTAESFIVLPTVAWTGEQYDNDVIYARLNSIYGVSSVTTVPGATLNEMVEGDSYFSTIDVPTSYLSRMGWTDLAGTTLHGTIYRIGEDGTGTAAATLTEGAYPKVIHNAVTTKFDIEWLTYPAGMEFTAGERAAGIANFRVEVQAVKAGKTLTILYNATMKVYRQDDET